MKYVVIGLCAIAPLRPTAHVQAEETATASLSFPKSPFDAIRAGIEAKLGQAKSPKDIARYQSELAKIDKKIARFRQEWIAYKTQQQSITQGG